MQVVTFDESHIKLQKMVKVESCKSTLAQFDRQLSYGIFGGSAQLEGAIGQEETSDFVRVTVPMAFYSHTRRVTIVANMVATVDGVKAEERAAADAAKKIAGDIEFDLFRGLADFSNAGVSTVTPSRWLPSRTCTAWISRFVSRTITSEGRANLVFSTSSAREPDHDVSSGRLGDIIEVAGRAPDS